MYVSMGGMGAGVWLYLAQNQLTGDLTFVCRHFKCCRGFVPLGLSMINPVADPVSGIYTTKSAGLSHRYFYAVDTSAEGQWAGKCGYVALTEAPWASSADVLMKTVPFIMHTTLLNMHLF